MTSNVKKKLGYCVNIFLMMALIFVSIPTGQAASASRTIEDSVLTAGNSTNITVVIQNDITQALALKETIPPGWVLTRGTDDADQFKASTNEWIWLTTIANTVKTVTYKVTVPSGTTPGIYNISGNITTSIATTGVAGDNTVEVVPIVIQPTPGTFGLVVTPLSAKVDVREIARYNLTLTNNGSAMDTYSLVTNKSNNATVNLSRNIVTVGQGNSAIVGLTVVSSTAGTYIVNVSATSSVDKNNSKTVTTTTNVTLPVLTIVNLKSVPNSAISSTSPAKISADVTKGIYNILNVEFGIVDSSNSLGQGVNTVLITSGNTSGVEGSYSPEDWPAVYVTLGNVAVTDIVSVNIGDVSTFAKVRGIFKANNASDGTDAIISFNRTTGNMSNITDLATGKLLTVQNANSTFRAMTAKFRNGNVTLDNASSIAFTLYSTTGNMAVNNPSITVKTVPNRNYKVYAMVTDTNSSTYQLIDINTIPVSTGGGSSSGSSSSTYPAVTSTPKKNVTAVPTVTTAAITTPIPTVTVAVEQTTVKPVETTPVIPIGTPQKKSPGIGIVAVIGIIGTIYIIRRRK